MRSVAALFMVATPVLGGSWDFWGKTASNDKYAAESILTPENAGRLQVAWQIEASMVSATPTVDEEAVYFVDWNGGLYKANKHTGEVLWFRRVGPLFGQIFSATRSSPALHNDRLIINSMVGARVAAVRKSDGTTIWSTTLPVTTSMDSMTNSPMIHDGVIYTSTMCGAEQTQARDEAYECCECVGQLFALSVETGEILWGTKTLPERCSGFNNEETCLNSCEGGDQDCNSRCIESCGGGPWYSGASILGIQLRC